ncbi:MAG: hypothetical protein ACPGQD_01020, partial [Planctomycetota bacterium]
TMTDAEAATVAGKAMTTGAATASGATDGIDAGTQTGQQTDPGAQQTDSGAQTGQQTGSGDQTGQSDTTDPLAGLSDATKELFEKKGFKTADDVAQAYTNLEKLIRGGNAAELEKLMKPGEGASDADMAQWREAAGIPTTVEGYDVKPYEDGREDVLGAELARIAHENDVPKAAWDALASRVKEIGDAASDHSARVYEDTVKEFHADPANKEASEMVARLANSLPEFNDLMLPMLASNDPAVRTRSAMELMAKMTTKLMGRERAGDTTAGAGEGQGMPQQRSSAELQRAIDAKRADPAFRERQYSRDSAERKRAGEELTPMYEALAAAKAREASKG